ncbi:DUF3861 domain-containing protein [Xanthomonas sp. H13-6]|uniref:DUF3861 domain-containing protein n=1 Tax=Xanthomonas chitinilytica TaxID=2989819 RepID=A0ABT3JUM9_9XANT|nr:DUF3861 domain-containing protein [Xanthomonas sp. H13-6]MCW4472208.1 DUF3861 domain-containing protein [Xanthomonas sp. H13-6]
MSSQTHRYRITVTPIEKDGLQCSGRCTIEFEQRSPQDWMRLLEAAQRQRSLSADEHAALLVASQLLDGLARSHAQQPDHPLAVLKPQIDRVTGQLQPSGG